MYKADNYVTLRRKNMNFRRLVVVNQNDVMIVDKLKGSLLSFIAKKRGCLQLYTKSLGSFERTCVVTVVSHGITN